MSHEVETMAYAHAVPWHGLGVNVDPKIPVEEMLVAAGLDWQVVLRQLYFELPPLPMSSKKGDSSYSKVPDRFALVRDLDNKVMTLTGKSWKPLQNSDMLGFMRDYVKAGGATLETAGALRGGRVVWGLAKLKHSYEVRKGDTVNGYLLITSPHEVGKAITVRTTTVRVVCANTMALANSSSTIHYSQNHLSEFNTAAAKEHVEAAVEQLRECEARSKLIAKLKINLEDTVKKVLVPVFHQAVAADDDLMKEIMQIEKQPKTLQEIIHSINEGPGAVPGTGWGVLNGVTHWADHVAGREQGSRMWRSWVGDNARRKQETESILVDLAA